MRIETTSDRSNQPSGGRPMSDASPYEIRQQAAADVPTSTTEPGVHRTGVMAEANLARLTVAGERAEVVLGADDTRIPQWLACWSLRLGQWALFRPYRYFYRLTFRFT